MTAMSSALERLKAAVSMKAQRRAVDLPDGSEFSYWSTPVTLAERTKAQKLSGGGDDAVAFALQLLVAKAQDENGQRMFSAGEVAELRNELPASVVESLMLQLLQEPESDDEEPTDMKSTGSAAKKGSAAGN